MARRVFFGVIMGVAIYFAMNAALHDQAVAIALAAGAFSIGYATGGRSRC